jgi:hypothetical protein
MLPLGEKVSHLVDGYSLTSRTRVHARLEWSVVVDESYVVKNGGDGLEFHPPYEAPPSQRSNLDSKCEALQAA